MSLIVVDVESDGPIPNKYSMICFGAVIVEPTLSKTFYGETAPISKLWIPEVLAISGFSREEHESFDKPERAISDFLFWIKANSKGSSIFISDNPAYDWQFINYYFHYYVGRNPFGYSARRIGDLYCGMNKDVYAKWKHLRGHYPHNHNPLSDALGNANAILKINELGLNFKLK